MKVFSKKTQTLGQSLGEKECSEVDPRWKGLYRLGGVSALIGVVIAIIEAAIETSSSSLTSSPTTVLGWFTLLQSDKILGLALLGIFEVVFFPLCLLMFLALYPALRRFNESLAAIAFVIYLISTIAYLTTNAALSMVRSAINIGWPLRKLSVLYCYQLGRQYLPPFKEPLSTLHLFWVPSQVS